MMPDKRGGEPTTKRRAICFPNLLAAARIYCQQIRSEVLIAIENEPIARQNWRGTGAKFHDGAGERFAPLLMALVVVAKQAEGTEINIDPGAIGGRRGRGGIAQSMGALELPGGRSLAPKD